MKTAKWIILIALVASVLVAGTDVTAKRTTVSKSFDVGSKGTLYVGVENMGANIEIKVWAKNQVDVRVDRISEDDLEYLEIEKEGNTISVTLDGDDNWGRHSSARIFASVPAGFDLDLGTSGGSIEVNGDIEGSVEARTAGGSIEVGNVDGELHLKTSGGSLQAGDVGADAELRTAGGSIDIGDVKGELSVATAGGSISMGTVGKNVEAGTAGGSISCEAVNGDAEVKTSGGSIDLGVIAGSVMAKTAGGSIKIGGATGEAVAKTAGGSIELSEITGFVKALTAGGDISVELDPTNEGKSVMETAGGDISLYLPAGAKCTIEAKIKVRDRWDVEDFEISSDFKAESRDSDKRTITARFVINGGGKLISIETVNGDIDIVKR